MFDTILNIFQVQILRVEGKLAKNKLDEAQADKDKADAVFAAAEHETDRIAQRLESHQARLGAAPGADFVREYRAAVEETSPFGIKKKTTSRLPVLH